MIPSTLNKTDAQKMRFRNNEKTAFSEKNVLKHFFSSSLKFGENKLGCFYLVSLEGLILKLLEQCSIGAT